jgi:hypothetical protein
MRWLKTRNQQLTVSIQSSELKVNLRDCNVFIDVRRCLNIQAYFDVQLVQRNNIEKETFYSNDCIQKPRDYGLLVSPKRRYVPISLHVVTLRKTTLFFFSNATAQRRSGSPLLRFIDHTQ